MPACTKTNYTTHKTPQLLFFGHLPSVGSQKCASDRASDPETCVGSASDQRRISVGSKKSRSAKLSLTTANGPAVCSSPNRAHYGTCGR